MPSAFSHPAVPLAITVAAGVATVPPRLCLAAVVASVLPDVDAFGYWAGVPYESPFGHRGFTHSFFFAALVALACTAIAPRLGASRPVVFAVVFLSGVSHGLLDAMTTGGHGIAFFAPFSNERYHFPWQVIRISPISVTRFFSERGLSVLASELRWIWLPAAVVAVLGVIVRRGAEIASR
ncbi:MAG TPA: metal-dependent hydrolase [Thermoanaerobaculia bacterium]|nr:metal-dependent hydrolase [Thermoanaerobaculia bacterium]